MPDKTKTPGLIPYILFLTSSLISPNNTFGQEKPNKNELENIPVDTLAQMLPQNYKYLLEVVEDPDRSFEHSLKLDVGDNLIKEIFYEDSVGLPFATKFLNILLGVDEYSAKHEGDSTRINVLFTDSTEVDAAQNMPDSLAYDTISVAVKELYKDDKTLIYYGYGSKSLWELGKVHGYGITIIQKERHTYLEKDSLDVHIEAYIEVKGDNPVTSLVVTLASLYDEATTSVEEQEEQNREDAVSIQKHAKKVSDMLNSPALDEKILGAYCNGKLDIREAIFALDILGENRNRYKP